MPGINVRKTGLNLNRMILEHGYTAADLADKLGVSRSNIYKWLRGDILPSIDNLYILSHMLNTSINDILVSA